MRHPNEERNSDKRAVVAERSTKEKNYDLFEATEEGDVERFKRLLREGADIMARDKNLRKAKGRTVLDVVEEKIESTTFFAGKYQAIKLAIIQYVFERLVQLALEPGIGIHLSIYQERFPSIFPAVFEFSDSEGKTLLHHFCMLGDPVQNYNLIQIGDLLLEEPPQTKDKLGNFPIYYLIQSGFSFKEVEDLLVSPLLAMGKTPLWLLEEANKHLKNNFGNSLLHYAVYYERLDWVKDLVKNHHRYGRFSSWIPGFLNGDLENAAGESPLDIAAMKGNLEIFILLFSKAASLVKAESRLNYKLVQAFLLAIQFQRISIVDYVLENHPAFLNVGFLQAIATGNAEMVWKFIGSMGVNIEGQYILGRPEDPIPFNCKKPQIKFCRAMPMGLACEIDSSPIVHLLLKNGAYLFKKSLLRDVTIDQHSEVILKCLKDDPTPAERLEIAHLFAFAPFRPRIFRAIENDDGIKLKEVLRSLKRDLLYTSGVFDTTNEEGLTPVMAAKIGGSCRNILMHEGARSLRIPVPLRPLIAEGPHDNNAPAPVDPAPQGLAEFGLDALAEMPLARANNNNAPADDASAPTKKSPYLDEAPNLQKKRQHEREMKEIGELKKLASLIDAAKQRGINIPGKYICVISTEAMRDPVVASDGGTYDRASLEPWFATLREKRGPLNGKYQEEFPNDILTKNRDFRNAMIRHLEKQIAKYDAAALEKLKSEAQLLQAPNGQALFSPAPLMQENRPEEAEVASVSPRAELTEPAHESTDDPANDNGPRLT